MEKAKKVVVEEKINQIDIKENYLKYILYTSICTFVCVLISTVFIIIIAVDKDNNKDNNYSVESTNGSGDSGNGSTNEEYDVSMFTEINTDKFLEAYNGSEKQIVYIGRPDCSYCVAFLPTLQKAQEELGYKTLYLNLNNVSSDDYTKITGLNDFLTNNFGYTPMVLVVQNGKIVSKDDSGEGWVGYAEYDTFKNYLVELGF